MAEYIDREEVKAWIADLVRDVKSWHPYGKGKNIPAADVFDMLSLTPAEDVQPVKHGEWLEREQVADIQIDEWQSCRCSVCKKYHTTPFLYYFNNYNYCPNCGAKMDGEEDD